MRINVYAEELTDRVEVVTTTADTGRTFYGLRFYLESSEKLHHSADDDDASAVTLWVKWNQEEGHLTDTLQSMLLRMLENLDSIEQKLRKDSGDFD